MKSEFHIICRYKNTPPECVFSSHNSSFKRMLSHDNRLLLDLDLRHNDEIRIDFMNKDDMDDNVVLIKKILIDDIDLQHYIYHGSFTPRYNTEWYNKQNPKPPASYTPCTELRHNGVWSIGVQTPIWKMIMNKWINDER